MVIETIRDRLQQDPFVPFLIRTSGGQGYRVASPDLVVLMRNKIFVAQPNSDHAATLSFLHITALEEVTNGHGSRPRRRRR